MSDDLRDRIADVLFDHYSRSDGLDVTAEDSAQAVIDALGFTTEEREAQEPTPVRRFGRTEWDNREVTLYRVVGRWEKR